MYMKSQSPRTVWKDAQWKTKRNRKHQHDGYARGGPCSRCWSGLQLLEVGGGGSSVRGPAAGRGCFADMHRSGHRRDKLWITSNSQLPGRMSTPSLLPFRKPISITQNLLLILSRKRHIPDPREDSRSLSSPRCRAWCGQSGFKAPQATAKLLCRGIKTCGPKRSF